jgi:hypothetical protein
MLYLTLFILGWLACGIPSYGWHLAFSQREWPHIAHRDRYQDICDAFFMSVFGPLALLCDLTACSWIRKHGWMLWPGKGQP